MATSPAGIAAVTILVVDRAGSPQFYQEVCGAPLPVFADPAGHHCETSK
jgi:hypothetical protein